MRLTEQQRIAIETPGNILVVAGAGTGKTGTLVERCTRLLLHEQDPVDVSRVLVVTFTEAAAAEVRSRIRRELDKAAEANPRNLWIQKQIAGLDSANISTLHSFCFTLIRDHFYELDLDPAPGVMPAEQADMLFLVTFEELLNEHFLGAHAFSADLKEIYRSHFRGWDKLLIALTKRIHHFTQTRPNPAGWFQTQFEHLSSEDPSEWTAWYRETIRDWCAWWEPFLGSFPENRSARECAEHLQGAKNTGESTAVQTVLKKREHWPRGKKEPFEKFFGEATFLESISAPGALQEDWNWCRKTLRVILQFAQQFAQRYSDAKRERGFVDFHDLEQFSLHLLWDPAAQKPTPVADAWRKRLDAIFVDEYQDINAAQDLIITAVSRDGTDGNRFLVGDIKQSIYRFRQADPTIFRRYLALKDGWTQAFLSDNFRSHEGILQFINPLFEWLMQGVIGGVVYDNKAHLRFGNREQRVEMAAPPDRLGQRLPVELNVLISSKARSNEESEDDEPDLEAAEKEAQLVAQRLRELRDNQVLIYHQKEKRTRPVDWKDMVVLLRAAAGKLEVYAKAFEAVGVPLHTKRDGFFTTQEVLDLVNLLTILDNPLQDIPLVAVLRSPLVAMTANELSLVRSHRMQGRFWHALSHFLEIKKDSDARQKIERFLQLFHRWRNPRASASLAQRLETILSDTGYADWLLTQPRGRQRHANVQQLLRVARQFDETRGESLYLFLRHIQDLQEAAGDIEPAPSSEENAVRLMTVHQSKGLEFPVVALAGLGNRFNTGERSSSILLHEKYGICSTIQPPNNPQQYASLPLWLASREERLESIAEEMRVFYVAMTRAENMLLLFGTATEKQRSERWVNGAVARPLPQQMLKLGSALDWLGAYGSMRWPGCFGENPGQLNLPFAINIQNDIERTSAPAESTRPIWSDEQLAALAERTSFTYPHAAAVSQPAKSSVSILRQRLSELDEESTPLATRLSLTRTDEARARGVAMHTFLERHDPAGKLDPAGLRSQAAALVGRGVLVREESDLLDFEAISAFWSSEVGREVRSRLLDLHRELPFTIKLTAADLALIGLNQAPSLPEEEFVLIQGIADLVVLGPKDIWLLDFKTDSIDPAELAARTDLYRPQLAIYSLALERIYNRPVKRAGLYFLSLREIAWTQNVI